jgi:F-type H+-transporting ATPase subunit a
MEHAESPIVIPFHWFGFTNGINVLTVSWFVTLLLFVLFFLVLRNLKQVPTGLQNFFEMIYDFVWNMAEPLVGKHTAFFFPLFFYLFLFIFFSNLMGLLPGSVSPTSRVDINAGMALIIFFLTQIWGFKVKGMKYLAHFLPPPIPVEPGAALWLKIMIKTISLALLVMMPLIHLIGEFVRPLSLTMRLFGNMMAKEKVLAVSILLMLIILGGSPFTDTIAVLPFFLRVFIMILGVLVSFLQAFVFMLLAMVYIGGAVSEHDEHEEHAEAPAH